MTDGKKTARDDKAVSPMEAQNEGPARKGPASEPLPATAGGLSQREKQPADTTIRKGGEGESRDDA